MPKMSDSWIIIVTELVNRYREIEQVDKHKALSVCSLALTQRDKDIWRNGVRQSNEMLTLV